MIIVPVPQPHPAPTAALVIHPGAGAQLTSNAIGTAWSARAGGQKFDHPWRPFLSGLRVRFNLGTVQSLAGEGPLEPTITVDGEPLPMSGKNGNTATPLMLDAKLVVDGISYAALAVHPDDATGELLKVSKVEIIHTNQPYSHDRTLGIEPLALIRWSGGRPQRIFAMRNFNLKYERVLPKGTASGAPKHLFF